MTASNAAVDNLAVALLDADPSLALARAGHPARVHPALEDHTLAGLTDNHERRRLAKRLVDEAFQILRSARRRSDRTREAWRREREARVEAGRLFADARIDPGCAALHLGHLHPESDVLADRHVREERVVLEDEAHSAVADRNVGGVLVAEMDVAAVGKFKPGDHAQDGRLARAGGAQQRDNLT